MALFGAIVAIGLGPAMWLGAQFGQVTLSPDRPPAVTNVQNEVEAPRGGAGAGNAPTGTEAIKTEPKANTEPLLPRTRDARRVVPKSASPSPTPSARRSKPAADPLPTSSAPGDDDASPPVESPAPPQDPVPPTGDSEDPGSQQPLPPADPQIGSGSDAVSDGRSQV